MDVRVRGGGGGLQVNESTDTYLAVTRIAFPIVAINAFAI